MSEIIVGRYRGHYLTAKDQQFVLVASPTGGDKGVGMVLPNLLNYPDSVVNFDLKGENFRYTSLFRQRCGQQVYLWAPFAEDGRTHRWNMLDAIARDSLFRVGDILAIGQSFYPSDCHPKDKYWNDNARNLFLGLVLYLMETPELPCTLGEVFRQSSGGGKPVKQHLEDILTARRTSSRPLSPECVDAFNRFQSASSESVGNIISTFNAPLLIFANPIVDAATSHSDFDLGQVRRRRMSIYLSIPPHRLSDAGILANLFFSQLIDLNTRQLPENDLTLKFECLLALDELAAIGKLGILARSNFYIRGYGLRLMSNLQSVAQAVGLYGEADARTLLADHTIHIAYPPADQAEAEELSKILGYLGQTAVSTSNSSTAGGSSHAENRAEHARALMLPQELRTMQRHQQIVLPRYCRPILCDKARYYEDHRFIDRLKSVSPALAALDRHGWRRVAHMLGAGPWYKVYPTEAQIKHAAFVLRELSVEVPRAPLVSRPPASTIHQPPPQSMPVRPVLPIFQDAEAPTPEEANAIVAAFFAQLPLFDTGDDSAAEAAEPETAIVNTANAPRHTAASTPAAAAAQTGNGYASIDLSALDP